MIKWWRNSSISVRIFVITFAMALFSTLVLGYAFSQRYADMLIQSEFNRIFESSKNTKNALDTTLKQITEVGADVASSSYVHQVLRGASDKSISDLVNSKLESYVFIQQSINGIHIIGTDGRTCSSDPSSTYQGLALKYQKVLYSLSSDSRDYKISFNEDYQYIFNMKEKDTLDAIVYISNIFDPMTDKLLGRLIIEISYLYINEVFFTSCMNYSQKAFLMTNNGVMICNNPINTIYTPIVNSHPELFSRNMGMQVMNIFEKPSALCSDTLDTADWIVVKILPLDSVTLLRQQISATTLTITVILIFIGVLFSILLSYSILKPISTLNRKLEEVQSGNLNVSIAINSKDEFGKLSASFNEMVKQLNQLIERTVEHEKSKADMEFKVLQAQINPHFIYNTLDSIKWLASMHNAHSVCDMTSALIKLLKYNLSSHMPITTLEEELNSVAQYIIIQKYRYGDCFVVKYHIDDITLSCAVLRFMLQPIVENSLLHGFDATTGEDCVVTISSRLEDGLLIIDVLDNGSGIDSEDLSIADLSLRSKAHFSSIGLANIQSRIQMQFGKEYGLFLKNREDGGLKVSIILPIIEN